MRTATSAGSLAARAAAVASVSTLVACFGHAAGHGAVPDGASLLLTVAAATGVGLVLARAGWTAVRLVSVLVAVQLAVHGAAWINGGAGSGVDPRLAGIAEAAPAHHTAPFSGRMLLAHAVAVVAAVILLLALDRACGFLAHVARRALQPVRRVIVPTPFRTPLRAQSRPVALPAAPHLTIVRGNAPPLLLGIG